MYLNLAKEPDAEGTGIWGLGEKGERIRKCKLVLIKYSWDVKYSLVNGVVITMAGAR